MIRRDMFRLGAALVGAPAAAKLGEAIGGYNAALQANAEARNAVVGEASNQGWSPEQEALRALLDEAEGRRDLRATALERPLDPDIACLRSWSPGAKMRAQMDRERVRRSFVRELRERLFGY